MRSGSAHADAIATEEVIRFALAVAAWSACFIWVADIYAHLGGGR